MHVLEKLLSNHQDKQFVNKLCDGLWQGFFTGINKPPKSTYECTNNLSARTDPHTVNALLHTELQKGYVIGPFHTPPFPTFRISPLGIAVGKYSDKKD